MKGAEVILKAKEEHPHLCMADLAPLTGYSKEHVRTVLIRNGKHTPAQWKERTNGIYQCRPAMALGVHGCGRCGGYVDRDIQDGEMVCKNCGNRNTQPALPLQPLNEAQLRAEWDAAVAEDARRHSNVAQYWFKRTA